MTSDNPFNPITIPEGLLLAEDAKAAQPPKPHQGTMRTKKKRRRRTGRRAKSQTAPGIASADAAAQSKWQRIKGRFTARLCSMDQETLKRILTAAGVGAGLLIAILLAIKLTPVALVLLAILGLAFLLRLWDRLRRPYYPV